MGSGYPYLRNGTGRTAIHIDLLVDVNSKKGNSESAKEQKAMAMPYGMKS